MKIVHFCAGLEEWNGMARNAREFVREETAQGHDSLLTNDPDEIAGEIDVVHIHGAWLPILWKAASRAKSIGARLIIMPEASYDPIRCAYHGWKKWLVAPWEHRMLARADVVIAACEAERDWIKDYHPGLNIEVTDLKRFFTFEEVRSKDEETRSEDGRSLHVLYLGRRHPLKGVRFLERAVQEINDELRIENEEWRIVDLKVESALFGEELEKIWEWCDVLCLPTLTEDFGRVIAEALEHGRPVITTDGAPVWHDLKPAQGYYLKGYRNGTDATRIRLLKDALIEFLG